MKHVCPSCHRSLQSRLSPFCSHCGATVPPQLLFSPEEKVAVETEETRARKALAATEKENEKKRRTRHWTLSGRNGTGAAIAMLASSALDSLREKRF